MSLRSSEHRQDRREQQRANEQYRYAHSSGMVVKLAIGVFHQVVEQVDRHDEECDDHECDEGAGTEVDAGLCVVDFVAGAGFEGVFLWIMLGEKHHGKRLGVRESRRYAMIKVSALLLTIPLGRRCYTR
jgi:hypothetical protein